LSAGDRGAKTNQSLRKLRFSLPPPRAVILQRNFHAKKRATHRDLRVLASGMDVYGVKRHNMRSKWKFRAAHPTEKFQGGAAQSMM
jgi:hypothetical protein